MGTEIEIKINLTFTVVLLFMFENDTYTYKGWMTSDYFLKRAFGVTLYHMAAVLILYGVILAVVLVLVLISVFFIGIAGMV